ncbi:MAG: AAA family ATPase [Acidobacteriota bacterium]|nr:AAA family ATPase [Acidobacteriota bacterium]
MVQVLCPITAGRQFELGVLADRLDAALNGEGSCVALTGEAGIGKSRLTREVARWAAARAATVVVGRATPSGAPAAYRALIEAVAQALRNRPVLQDPAMALWLPALAGIVVPVGTVGTAGPVGTARTAGPVGTASAVELSPAGRGEALLQLLRRVAEPTGLVVVLEDLHWADPDTLAVVEYLGDNLAGQRILCLVTVRSEEHSPALDLLRRWRSRQGASVLELARLSEGDVTAMVQACAPQVSETVLERVRISAEGVPLLVEELLASPGVPTSFADTVRQRLAQLPASHRRVVDAAAVLGRYFDWRLLAPMTGLPPDVVSEALGAAIERLLLRVDDGSFRFRHALTRDAVLADLLPPDQVTLAAAGLAALEGAHPDPADGWHELAADLAERSGDRDQAAIHLTVVGRHAVRSGALATAAHVLERAAALAGQDETRAAAALLLVEALALAGRVDEAASATRRALDASVGTAIDSDRRSELNLLLAQAAVTAGRWPMAAEQLQAALGGDNLPADPRLIARVSVLEAEVALAADEIDRAQSMAEKALDLAQGAPEVRCHALEVLGRIKRLSDPSSAHRLFEEALASAEKAGLAVWQARALHELGTVDMFDHLGTERLEQARHAAERLGAYSTAASINLQLAAVGVSRWSPAAAADHARSAYELAEALALGEVRDKALLFLAEAAALRADTDGVEQHLGLIRWPDLSNSPWEGFAWGTRGEAAIAAGNIPQALAHLGQASSILARFPHAEPAAFRALWPLLLAAMDDPRAPATLADARRSGLESFKLNRGLLGYAAAVLTARDGSPERAETLAGEADRGFVNATTWRMLAGVLAAESAATRGWGQPAAWLAEGIDSFDQLGLPGLAAWCRTRLGRPEGNGSRRSDITAREADVLDLVAQGLANKEIAQRLAVSPRTVEKHIEALLRKTGTRSRTQLAVWVSQPAPRPPHPPGAH